MWFFWCFRFRAAILIILGKGWFKTVMGEAKIVFALSLISIFCLHNPMKTGTVRSAHSDRFFDWFSNLIKKANNSYRRKDSFIIPFGSQQILEKDERDENNWCILCFWIFIKHRGIPISSWPLWFWISCGPKRTARIFRKGRSHRTRRLRYHYRRHVTLTR